MYMERTQAKRSSSCPQTMESWGNKNYKLLWAGIMSVKKERASEVEFTPLREWNHDCPPAQTKTWANALPQHHAAGSSHKFTVLAKWKVSAARQALTGETWRKTEAHLHTITSPRHLWNKHTWLILSESIEYQEVLGNLVVWLERLTISVGNKPKTNTKKTVGSVTCWVIFKGRAWSCSE